MGPLAGMKIIELAGIGPVPFCSTLLSDMGAQVIRVDRTAPLIPRHRLPRQNVSGYRSAPVSPSASGGVPAVRSPPQPSWRTCAWWWA